MLKPTALALTLILSFTLSAEAGGRRVQYRPAPAPVAGTVNNFYGPTNVYQGNGTPTYSYDYSNAYPYGGSTATGGGYAGAYAGVSAYGSYGAYYGDYGAPWGQPF